MSSIAPTRAALLTPAGRGAVAVVAVAGPDALRLVSERFCAPAFCAPASASAQSVSAQSLPAESASTESVSAETAFQPGRIRYGRWGSATGEEVVVSRRGPQRVEVHCHGGRQAAEAILNDLARGGARVAAWHEYLSFEQGHEQGHFAIAAARALAQARTERAALVLLDQVNGSLDRCWRQIEQHLADHREQAARELLETLASRAEVGLRLVSGWQVTLAGQPNVGKSSLVNALLGFQRTIVFDQPGTTRDAVCTLAAFGGWPVQLSDTAGLRDAGDALEAAGVQRATARLTASDLVVLVFDAVSLSQDEGKSFDRWPAALRVLNKWDLVADTESVPAELDGCLRTSALTGQGVEALADAIASRLVPVPPAAGEPVVFAEDQLAAIRATEGLIAAGRLDDARRNMAAFRQDRAGAS